MITGHRPSRLGGYSKDNPTRTTIKKYFRAILTELNNIVPVEAITGMAVGVDQDFAEVCGELDIPFTSYVPFEGQENNWPQPAKDDYYRLLEESEEIVYVSSGSYTPKKMKNRNVKMVNEADIILAVWDKKSSGGTFHTINYNRKTKRKPVIFIPLL